MQGKQHEPSKETRGAVQMMTAAGIPQAEICISLGISKPTLHKHYRDEIDSGAIKANAMVGQFLYETASGRALLPGAKYKGATYADCTRAAMFWAKTRMGWRETDHMVVTGRDGGAVEVAVAIDYTRLGTATLKELEAAMVADDPETDHQRPDADQE